MHLVTCKEELKRDLPAMFKPTYNKHVALAKTTFCIAGYECCYLPIHHT